LRSVVSRSPVAASVRGFNGAGEHEEYSLAACIESVRSVGYGNTLALDYIGRAAAESGRKKSSKSESKVDLVAELDTARRQLSDLTTEPELPDDLFDEEE
jgi:hypothetical protein